MAGPTVTERLRLTPRSVVVAVGIVGGTLALLAVVSASRRVLGWAVAAALLAALLHPLVTMLERRMPRGLAIAAVFLGLVATVGLVVYGVFEDISDEVRRLERAAPQAARELADEERFAEFAEEVDLVARVERFVDEIPQRLQGGTQAEAIQAAATRGVAYLASGVLVIFLLLHGPRMLDALATQLPAERRARLRRVAAAAYSRSCRYVRRAVGKAAVSALVAYALAWLVGLPGPMPLAVWMALWSLVPLVGTVMGGLPLVVLAAAFEAAEVTALLAVLVVAHQVLDALVLQRWVESRSMRVGPFLVVAAGFLGLELYGVGGMLVGIVAVVAAAAVADEMVPGAEVA